MVFEQLPRSSPRRRASHPLAEGFSPTASAGYRIEFLKDHKPRATVLRSRPAPDVNMGEPGSPIPPPAGALGRAWPLRRGMGKASSPIPPPAGAWGRAWPLRRGMGKPGSPIPLRGGGVGKPGFPTSLAEGVCSREKNRGTARIAAPRRERHTTSTRLRGRRSRRSIRVSSTRKPTMPYSRMGIRSTSGRRRHSRRLPYQARAAAA